MGYVLRRTNHRKTCCTNQVSSRGIIANCLLSFVLHVRQSAEKSADRGGPNYCPTLLLHGAIGLRETHPRVCTICGGEGGGNLDDGRVQGVEIEEEDVVGVQAPLGVQHLAPGVLRFAPPWRGGIGFFDMESWGRTDVVKTVKKSIKKALT